MNEIDEKASQFLTLARMFCMFFSQVYVNLLYWMQ
ncbi:hypothetical protein VCB_000834 [Vibrio cholerae TMA 21]|nr:hypothetical protein VCB_000834 [Vibrio cholerae TMA 21]